MASHTGLVRAFWVGLSVLSGTAVGACGKTSDSVKGSPGSGGTTVGEGGTVQASESGSPADGAMPSTTPGMVTGGTASQGGKPSAGGDAADAGETGNATCMEGALCHCGDSSGTLHCSASTDSGECSCPTSEICATTKAGCFEPCGGDPRGAWVLEQTCMKGASAGGSCPDALISGTAPTGDFRIRVGDDGFVESIGQERLDVKARVPLSCLRIDSVNRCLDAEFYVGPFLFGTSKPVRCKATECGDCECSGAISAYDGAALAGIGQPWQPGSTTLPFGAIQVPYCVDGDSLWVGGTLADGTQKASYEFRRKSCTGTPVPCEERDPSNCGPVDDGCWPGHCVATAGAPQHCEGLSEQGCASEDNCQWQATQRCWGDTARACDFANCDTTPGCSWGKPQARCRGDLATCYERGALGCTISGCTLRSCVYGDGGNLAMDCAALSANACGKAPGCAWSGSGCLGTTDCWTQTDANVCSALGCSQDAVCTGEPIAQCSDFSVEECTAHEHCRIEW